MQDFVTFMLQNLHAVDLLHTHATGVLSHGHGGFHAYVDINEYPHDPNLTINIILKELLRQAKANVSNVCAHVILHNYTWKTKIVSRPFKHLHF